MDFNKRSSKTRNRRQTFKSTDNISQLDKQDKSSNDNSFAFLFDNSSDSD